MRVPQVLITMAPDGTLVAELPGSQATRRQVPLKAETAGETLVRILQAQAHHHVEIGEDGAPTVRQVQHWERHSVFPSPQCRFCIAEGRVKGEAPRRARRQTISEPGAQVTVRKLKAGASSKHKTLVAKKSAEEMGL